MRQIKYRAWNKELGEMWIGGYVQFDTGNIWFDNEDGDMFEYTQAEFPLMQYTGLKDKNGKEIYEGDILQDRQGKGEVKWIQEHCSFLVRVRKPHGYHKLEGDYQLNLTEVVGNIYENPELLDAQIAKIVGGKKK